MLTIAEVLQAEGTLSGFQIDALLARPTST